jgi:hypothetical protein
LHVESTDLHVRVSFFDLPLIEELIDRNTADAQNLTFGGNGRGSPAMTLMEKQFSPNRAGPKNNFLS